MSSAKASKQPSRLTSKHTSESHIDAAIKTETRDDRTVVTSHQMQGALNKVEDRMVDSLAKNESNGTSLKKEDNHTSQDNDGGLQQIKLSNRDKSAGIDDHRGKLGSLSKVPDDDFHSDGMPRVS